MNSGETVKKNLIEVSEIKLPRGWRGLVTVRSGDKNEFPKSGWEKVLDSPENLFGEVQRTLNSNSLNMVAIKDLDIGGRCVKSVIKQRRRSWGLRDFFRSLGKSQAMRNFKIAIKAKEYGLPTALPLAAVYRRKLFLCDQSIYLSKYVDGATLYDFLKNMQAGAVERYRLMRELSEQMANIFTQLHKNNLWHRDAKASNFVVNKDNKGDYQVVITDVDGIKQYVYRSENRQMQGLWHLAASVMKLGMTRTDYLRMFLIYCDRAGIGKERRRGIYQQLKEKAEEKFRRKQAKQER